MTRTLSCSSPNLDPVGADHLSDFRVLIPFNNTFDKVATL